MQFEFRRKLIEFIQDNDLIFIIGSELKTINVSRTLSQYCFISLSSQLMVTLQSFHLTRKYHMTSRDPLPFEKHEKIQKYSGHLDLNFIIGFQKTRSCDYTNKLAIILEHSGTSKIEPNKPKWNQPNFQGQHSNWSKFQIQQNLKSISLLHFCQSEQIRPLHYGLREYIWLL